MMTRMYVCVCDIIRLLPWLHDSHWSIGLEIGTTTHVKLVLYNVYNIQNVFDVTKDLDLNLF